MENFNEISDYTKICEKFDRVALDLLDDLSSFNTSSLKLFFLKILITAEQESLLVRKGVDDLSNVTMFLGGEFHYFQTYL